MLLHYNQKPIDAEVELPGSKSISNRLLILKEVCGWRKQIKNLSDSKDTRDLVKAISQIRERKNNVIDIGHAGTDMRFLTALLSITPGEWILTGSERMKQRPIFELVNGLRQLGADISFTEQEGFPPLKINGKKLTGSSVEIDASISSQFVTAILLISPAFDRLEIRMTNNIVSRSYILMTMELLSNAGMSGLMPGHIIRLHRSARPVPESDFKLSVEADWSSASYWFSVVALAKDATVVLKGLDERSLQGDSIVKKIYEQLGVSSKFKKGHLTLTKIPVSVKQFHYDFTDCPDLAQTVAVTCLGLGIDCTLTGLSTLKVKETDRIVALKTELEKFGATVTATNHSLQLQSPNQLRTLSSELQTYKDHRMAMSFAPLALLHPIEIEDPDVVEKSYPQFWEHLKMAGIS